jgi:hypothetical protein
MHIDSAHASPKADVEYSRPKYCGTCTKIPLEVLEKQRVTHDLE